MQLLQHCTFIGCSWMQVHLQIRPHFTQMHGPAAADSRHSSGLGSLAGLAARTSAKSPMQPDSPAYGTGSKRGGRRGGGGRGSGKGGGKDWEPTILGTALAAAAGTALAIAWFLTSAALQGGTSGPSCIVYTLAEVRCKAPSLGHCNSRRVLSLGGRTWASWNKHLLALRSKPTCQCH